MSSDISSTSQEKRLARLAAVQTLYQMALSQRTAKQVLAEHQGEFQALLRENAELAQDESALINQQLLGAIVSGVERDSSSLDEMIAGAVSGNVSHDRLETLLRAILRAGLFELQQGGGESAGVIINDYVDIAHAYFSAKEPGLVNAILDRVSKALRQS